MVFCIDNDVLKFLDCFVGYFGNGCIEKCVLLLFGRVCSDICNCLFCYYVFGCILFLEFKGIIKFIYNIYKKLWLCVILYLFVVFVCIVLLVFSLLIIILFCFLKDKMIVYVLFFVLKCLILEINV